MAVHLLSYLAPRPFPYFAGRYPGYESLNDPICLQAERFSGQVCVLIDGGCFSTTGHLLALMKEHRIGTMIGCETTGTYLCHDDKKYAELRHSRAQLQYARRSYAVAVRGWTNAAGVLPDIEVSVKVADYLSGKDAGLQKALEIISAHNSRKRSTIGKERGHRDSAAEEQEACLASGSTLDSLDETSAAIGVPENTHTVPAWMAQSGVNSSWRLPPGRTL